MSIHRYIFADLLTNQVLVELPLHGVTYSRMLNKPGMANFSFGLDYEGYPNDFTINGTIPGRTALYIERDGALVWGGVIWTRTWDEEGKSFQYYGETFESFFYRTEIRKTLTYTNVDQRNILISLLQTMQQNPYWNIGIVLPSNFVANIVRTKAFYDYEAWDYGKAIDYLIGYDQGFDYTIEVAYNTSGVPTKYLRTNNVLGVSVDQTQIGLDYPGNIANFWWPESASKGATTVLGIGAGEGSTMLRTRATNQQLLDAGYPELVNILTNKDVAVPNTLASKAAALLNATSTPVVVPTYELNPESSVDISDFALGDSAKLKLESSRFPGGVLDTTVRIIGWNVTPASSETTENISLVSDDQNLAG